MPRVLVPPLGIFERFLQVPSYKNNTTILYSDCINMLGITSNITLTDKYMPRLRRALSVGAENYINVSCNN